MTTSTAIDQFDTATLPIPAHLVAPSSLTFQAQPQPTAAKNQIDRSPSRFLEPADWFLFRVYALSAARRTDEAADVIFERIDTLLSAGMFADCDRLLANVELDRLDSDLVVAFLTMTAAADDQLTQRRGLRHRAQIRIAALKGAEYAGRLLGRIR